MFISRTWKNALRSLTMHSFKSQVWALTAQRTASFCRLKDYFLGLREKSIIKTFLHRITETNIMVTTARKNRSELKEMAQPLWILSLPEEVQPAVLCCNPWILSPPGIGVFGSLIISSWKNPTQYMTYPLSRMHKSSKQIILIILYHHLQFLDLRQGYQRITVLF